MSATDVGWALPGGVKDNKEENDALAEMAWPLQLFLWSKRRLQSYRDRAGYGRLGSLISRGHNYNYSYCIDTMYNYSMQELFTNS